MANKVINQCTCKYCGKEYIARNPKSNCCKEIQCLKAANHEMYSMLNQSDFKHTKVCEVCGENYWTNNKKSRCCNTGYCAGSLGILSPISKGFNEETFEQYKCKECGEIFIAKHGMPKIYCSDKCKDVVKTRKSNANLQRLELEFIGNKFGLITGTKIVRENRDGKINAPILYFDCECGGNGSARCDIIRGGYVQSCGCLNASMFDTGNHGILHFLRRKISTWITNSRNNYNGQCDITGISENTAIHHLYPFASIALESLDISGLPLMEVSEYTKKELEHITKVFLDLHNEYPAGVCILEGLHQLFHGNYGHRDFTPDDYYEFKQRCINGEFGDLSEYNKSKRRDSNEIRQCSYCGTTDGEIYGRTGKLGADYCQKHYSQMLSKGYCFEPPPPKPKLTKEPHKTSSGYHGITWFKNQSTWMVRIKVNGKRIFIGNYKELEDAIAARQNAEKLRQCS